MAVRVEGLRELDRAFGQISKDLRKEMRDELKKVGEPVRRGAEGLAVANIRNIGGTWSRMRLGVTSTVAYVAPQARRRGGSPRPNLKPLLLNRAMEPALDQNTEQVVAGLEKWVDRLGGEAGF